MLLKWLLETVLGATLGAAVLFLVIAARYRRLGVLREVKGFWIAMSAIVVGVAGTSYVLFTALLHGPAVRGTAAAWEYFAAQSLKVSGILGLVYVLTKYLPVSEKSRHRKQEGS